MNPAMTGAERAVFAAFLRGATHYFEFGMGGSTVLAAKLVRGSVTAIDSNPEWLARTAAAIDRTGPEIDLRHVDIGPVGDLGMPRDRSDPDRFTAYSAAIAPRRHRRVDLCLVDGRFRVACALQALVSLGPDAFVIVHDYWSRPHYHAIAAFARCVCACDDMAVFRRAPLSLHDRLLLRRRLRLYRRHPQ